MRVSYLHNTLLYGFVKRIYTFFYVFFGFLVDTIGMFGLNLKRKMKELGITAKDLALKIETDADREGGVKLFRSVENWTGGRGAVPSAERAVAIARALGVTVEYLVTGKDSTVLSEDSSLISLARKYRQLLEDFEALSEADKQFYARAVGERADRYREEQKKRQA